MPNRRLKAVRRPWWHGIISATILVAIAFAIVWWRPWQFAGARPAFITASPPASARQGVATIESIKTGHRGKYGPGIFAYTVRLDDGVQADMTIGEAFSPGTRLRLLYSRGGGNGPLFIHAYELCRNGCYASRQ